MELLKIKFLSNPKNWIGLVSKNKMEQREHLDGLVSVLISYDIYLLTAIG